MHFDRALDPGPFDSFSLINSSSVPAAHGMITTMKRPRKQLLLKLGVFLLLGILLNCVVAIALSISQRTGWVFGDNSFLKKERLVRSEPRTWFVATVRRFGALDVATRSATAKTAALIDVQQWDQIGSSHMKAHGELDLPSWCFASRTSDELAGRERLICIDEAARGWPFHCVRYEIRSDAPATTTNPTTMGIVWAFDGRPVPGRPIWAGFALNSAFYAALLWCILYVPRVLRRFIRIRRHRCPACGYQIDSAPGIGPRCSECGAALPASWSANAP